eukprot:10581150-Ditylum_brightwellii.AAC.1
MGQVNRSLYVQSTITNKEWKEPILDDICSKLGSDIDIFQGDPLRPTSAQLRRTKKARKCHHNNSYKLRQDFLKCLSDDIIDRDASKNKASIVRGIKDRESKKR